MLGLTDRDEGSNAEAAREMVASGDGITPTLNGAPRFAKPILLYWLISGSYLAFGVSEFTARLPSALFGTLLVLMQYVFATRMFGPTVGLRAALMLLLNFEVLALGRMVLTDMVLVFFTTLSIFCFFLAASPPDGRGRAKRWYWGFYIGMALATLTKGPVGVLVPLLAVIPYLLLTGRWREVARGSGRRTAGRRLLGPVPLSAGRTRRCGLVLADAGRGMCPGPGLRRLGLGLRALQRADRPGVPGGRAGRSGLGPYGDRLSHSRRDGPLRLCRFDGRARGAELRHRLGAHGRDRAVDRHRGAATVQSVLHRTPAGARRHRRPQPAGVGHPRRLWPSQTQPSVLRQAALPSRQALYRGHQTRRGGEAASGAGPSGPDHDPHPGTPARQAPRSHLHLPTGREPARVRAARQKACL